MLKLQGGKGGTELARPHTHHHASFLVPQLKMLMLQGCGGRTELASPHAHRDHSTRPGWLNHGPLRHVHVLSLLRQGLATSRLQLQASCLALAGFSIPWSP